MFTEKTVLVLGAGASRPYGFPTSAQLRALILGDEDPKSIFRTLGIPNADDVVHSYSSELVACALQSDRHLQEFRRTFFEAQRVSIDAFVSGRMHDPNSEILSAIARNLISHTILFCERHSKLDGDWYQWLLEFLIAEGRDFPSERLAIITFNYDRSLEYYLWRAFKAAFALTPLKATEMLERIEFIHVYGSTGNLLLSGMTTPGLPWGSEEWPQGVADLGLVTPRSQVAKHKRIKAQIEGARQVIFLGFGFWKENFDVLLSKGEEDVWWEKKVYASCRGLWASTQKAVNDRFGVRPRDMKIQHLIEWGDPDATAFDFLTKLHFQ